MCVFLLFFVGGEGKLQETKQKSLRTAKRLCPSFALGYWCPGLIFLSACLPYCPKVCDPPAQNKNPVRSPKHTPKYTPNPPTNPNTEKCTKITKLRILIVISLYLGFAISVAMSTLLVNRFGGDLVAISLALCDFKSCSFFTAS